MISVSKASVKDQYERAKNNYFYAREILTVDEFCRVITTHAWSPIIWFNNTRRKEDFFKECAYLALDFDDGFTLDECDAWIKENDYLAIVALSKSHQKIKEQGPGKDPLPACDRFRVVIPFTETVRDVYTYKGMMREIMRREPTSATDQACKDDKRFFFPCREIHKVYRGKNKFPVLKPGIDFEDQKEIARKSVEKHALYREYKVMGQRERIILERGYDEQGRGNPTILALARALTLQGFSESEIRNEIIAAGFDKATAWERALERGIMYGLSTFQAAEESYRNETAKHQEEVR